MHDADSPYLISICYCIHFVTMQYVNDDLHSHGQNRIHTESFCFAIHYTTFLFNSLQIQAMYGQLLTKGHKLKKSDDRLPISLSLISQFFFNPVGLITLYHLSYALFMRGRSRVQSPIRWQSHDMQWISEARLHQSSVITSTSQKI